MNKFLLSGIAACALALTAGAASKLVLVQGGNVAVQFNPAKEQCMIDAYWNGKPVLTGPTGFALSYKEPKGGWVGTQRTHNGMSEKLVKFTVKVDGKEIASPEGKITGNVAECERIVAIRDVKVVYQIKCEGDKLTETVSYTSSKDVTLGTIYHYVPWNKRFTEYACTNRYGEVRKDKFTKANKFLFSDVIMLMVIGDPQAQEAGVLKVKSGSMKYSLQYLKDSWDAPVVGLIEAQNLKLPAGKTITYRFEIDFVKAPSAEAALTKADAAN